jgi:FixJ family two-component response regulator
MSMINQPSRALIPRVYLGLSDLLKSLRLRDTSCFVTDVKAPGMAEVKRHSHLVGSNMRVAPIVSASVAFQQAGRP